MGCSEGTWVAAALWGLAVSRSACRVRGGGGERAKVRRAGRRGRCFGWEEGARTALMALRDAACKVSNSLDTPARSRPPGGDGARAVGWPAAASWVGWGGVAGQAAGSPIGPSTARLGSLGGDCEASVIPRRGGLDADGEGRAPRGICRRLKVW